jgi:hypothetical protein
LFLNTVVSLPSAGERELAKSGMITHFSGGFQIPGIFERKRFVFEPEKLP